MKKLIIASIIAVAGLYFTPNSACAEDTLSIAQLQATMPSIQNGRVWTSTEHNNLNQPKSDMPITRLVNAYLDSPIKPRFEGGETGVQGTFVY